ncbi:MAG: hypothetical protein AB8B50_02285 [Pirellulaceae bacterium]
MRGHKVTRAAAIVLLLAHSIQAVGQESNAEAKAGNLKEVPQSELDRLEKERTTPQPTDLIAKISIANKPVANLEVELEIKRTYGFFSGAGNPPISSRTPSNDNGELRFDNENNWIRDRVVGQIAYGDTSNELRPEEVAQEQIDRFSTFTWKISGYWPKPNSRIELSSVGSPKLWCQRDNDVELALPELHFVAVRAMDWKSEKPCAQVRLHLNTRLRQPIKFQDGQFRSVDGFAWTDHYGIARLWLPQGDYSCFFQSTVAFAAIESNQQNLANVPIPVFSPIPVRMHGGLDNFRTEAYVRRSSWFPDNPSIQVRPPSDGKVAIQDLRIVGPERMVP